MSKIPLVVIYGATSSGKTDLAVLLAKRFNGEVVSSDSRQVYKKINIASGKVTKTEAKGIKHHLIDIVDPRKKIYSAGEFVADADNAIVDIYRRGKLPILAGGTMFYISALLREVPLPKVEPNFDLRGKLEKLSTEDLYKKLLRINPRRAKQVDKHNRPRIIRSLEVSLSGAEFPNKPGNSPYTPLKLGIEMNRATLKERIEKRVDKRVRAGMVSEAEKLHAWGLSYKKMRELGLEMRHLADYLQKKIDKEELKRRIKRDAWKYAKRQLTWWKKDKDIIWIPYNKKGDFIKEVKKFYKKIH